MGTSNVEFHPFTEKHREAIKTLFGIDDARGFSATTSWDGSIKVEIDRLPKQKRYLLQLPDTEDSEGEYALYAHKYEGRWEVDEAETDPDYAQPTVTEADLKDAPKWVLDIKPVEVHDAD